MSKQGMLMRAAAIALFAALVAAPAATADSVPAVGESPSAATAVDAVTPASLWGVRVEPGDAGPVVTIATDGRVEYESFLLDNPDRLVVDLPGAVNRLTQVRYDVEGGGVVQVRAAQFRLEPLPVARVVFDLEQPLSYEIERDGSRLVVRFGAPQPDSRPTSVADLPAWAADDDWAVEANSALGEIAGGEETTPLGEPSEPTAGEDPPETPVTMASPLTALEEPQPAEPGQDPGSAPVALDTEAPESFEAEAASRSIEPDAIERLLQAPAFAAAAQDAEVSLPSSFRTQKITTDEVVYSGKRISLNLVDADIKQVFRLFHEISGVNFVLDPGVQGRVTIVVDNVPWDQALDLILKNNGLDKILENNVIRIASTQKLANEAAQRKQLKEAKELEVELVTITRTLSYAKARDVQQVLLGRGSGGGGGSRGVGVLSPRGTVISDERTNTLIISDIPKKIGPLDQLISTLDSETPQVMIEARVVETSREYVRDLGVVWGLQAVADSSRGTQTGLPGLNNAAVRYGLNLPGEGGASTLAFSFSNIIDSFTLDIALSALESEGYGRVLSAPKVATQNNERAEIEQGVRIPVVNTTATEINVEYVSASLRLQVTPQITAEGTVILDIIVENNSPDFVNTVGDVPPINTQRAQTKVLISDGGTTVIGGIFAVNEGTAEVGVPWFRKIPVFGWLFKQQQIRRENRELLIFITPKIMKLG